MSLKSLGSGKLNGIERLGEQNESFFLEVWHEYFRKQ